MKRRDLEKHLRKHGCEFLREGANHTMFINRATMKLSSVPRHSEIKKFMVRKICDDLGIPWPPRA